MVDDKFVFTLDFDKQNQATKIKSLYEDLLLHRAKELIGQEIKYYSKVVGVNPKRFVVKRLKGRWGSITKKGTISLNYNLLKAPEDVIEYIIIHELCHFVIGTHSHHFWRLLSRYVTDYKTKVEWLEMNGKYLLN